MNVFEILIAFCALYCAALNAAPIKRIDQRQDGDLNIQAHLDKIVLLIVPNKNINILDIKGQGPFEHYEDILPLLGKENNAVGADLKYNKLSPDDVKLKTFVLPATTTGAASVGIVESKEDKKETAAVKLEPSSPLPLPPSPPTPKIVEPKEFKKPEVRETTPKKIEGEPKMAAPSEGPNAVSQKKMAPKSDNRIYQTLHSGNNRERVIALSSQELEQKKTDLPEIKIEKL